MSLAQDLKQRLISIAEQAGKERGSLSAYHQRFASARAQVDAALAGSSTQDHRQILMALQQADQALAAATNALHNVSLTAKAKAAQI